MCHVIDSESVLLNYLIHSRSDEISFKELREIRKLIEEKFDDVYLDITMSSIKNTVELHKDLLDLELTKILFKKENLNKEVNESIELTNLNLPSNIKEKYLEAMTELV